MTAVRERGARALYVTAVNIVNDRRAGLRYVTGICVRENRAARECDTRTNHEPRNTKRVHDARHATRVTRRVITSRETTNVSLSLCLEVGQPDDFDENFNSFVYVLYSTKHICCVMFRVVRFLNVN